MAVFEIFERVNSEYGACSSQGETSLRRDHFISFFFPRGQKYLALVSFDPNEKNFCL